ncbi:MAG: acyl-CoA dehydrogenase family protein [bacterium]|nr:acyl-CoA dehydrogenase [Gammaproteobacteria bacterium]HIL97720.1 acyl-CoA dehydrogenase [Pseudomonadales bacterium]
MTKTIEFSEEQIMLLDTAMDFCRTQSPISKVRAQLDVANGFDTDQWRAMVDLGWLGVAIPESHGGIGLGMADVVPIVECMGRQLMGSPFFASTLAGQALVHGGTEAQKSTWLPRIAAGTIVTLALQEESGDWDLRNLTATATQDGDQVTLSGKKTFVMDATVADLIIASVSLDGNAVLVCIESGMIPENQIVREVVIDETRRCYEVSLDGITVPVSAMFAHQCFGEIENAALLILSAEMAGGIAGVLNTILEYLNTRKQFDRLIGSYQALKHPAVDILLGLEATRSHVYHAATVYDEGDGKELEISLKMAKAAASEHFAFAGDRAIQFHGGFGFTFECDAQLYLRRALWSQYQYGDEKYHRQHLASLLLD